MDGWIGTLCGCGGAGEAGVAETAAAASRKQQQASAHPTDWFTGKNGGRVERFLGLSQYLILLPVLSSFTSLSPINYCLSVIVGTYSNS